MIAERISGWHWEPMVEMRICWNRWNLCKMRRYIGDVISKWNNVGERMNVSGGDNRNRCNSKYLYRISIKSIIFSYLCIGCGIRIPLLVAFRLLFRKVKRPKFIKRITIGTLNAHALWRGCVYIRLGTWSSLLWVSTYPRFFFFLS